MGVRRLPPALEIRDFRLLIGAVLATGLSSQMLEVAIGWQVYAINRSALDLGLIGLAEFLPMLLLALPAGQLADRLPRRLVFAVSVALSAAVAVCLLLVTLAGASQFWQFMLLAAGIGAAGAIGNPAARALPPVLVPAQYLASGLALRSIAMRVGAIVGPAIGGALFALQAELVYGVGIGLFLASLACIAFLRVPPTERTLLAQSPPRLESLLAGISLIRRTPVLLGAISLDLFAVLFGGAVALLPLFTRSILDAGPAGLGLLRAAPSVGGLLAAAILATRPLGRHSGRTLLVVVAGFGAAMIVFGLSRSFPLSFAALAVSGFLDMISVNIRATIAALAAPDELRGRVLAVEMVFISASNELGAFESGLAASLLGAVPAVVAGGAITIALAVVWARLFPPLAQIDRLEDVRPAGPSIDIASGHP
jgi:MFS family permease